MKVTLFASWRDHILLKKACFSQRRRERKISGQEHTFVGLKEVELSPCSGLFAAGMLQLSVQGLYSQRV